MKTVTNNFKQEIAKLGREIDFKFFLHTNDKLITEDVKFLMTESNRHLVVEQFDDTEVDEVINAEDIYNVSIATRGKLLSTMMKELDFEISNDLRIGDVIDCEFGVKVNDSYEYVNYGSYMVFSKEFNEDTKTFSYVAYDRMLLTMQEVTNFDIIQDIMVGQAIISICNEVGLQVDTFPELPNLLNEIADSTFDNMEITYRDVLDMICQCLGVSMIVENKQLKLKTRNDTIVDTFNEQYLKDTNVSFGKKYGPVNSVVLSRSEDNDNIYRRDEESIEKNGLCEYKIKDNPILLLNDREDYIDEIFNQLNGLEYYVTDFNSTGITYLDWLDFYNVTIGNKTYKCLMLNDEIKIEQGLEESIYCEEPEETVTPYKTSSKTDKEVSFIVDKQRGQINAKVSKGDVINEINLDESGAEINADKISLAGKTIALTSDDITISSTNFSVTKDGNINAKGGTIGGCNIDSAGIYSGSGNNTAGVGLYGSRYAFWAGGSIDDTGNANFSVGHGGNLVAKNANIRGTINATSGTFNTNDADLTHTTIYVSTGTAYNGEVVTNILPAIIELSNYATDSAGVIEPQLRLYDSLTGSSTTIGSGGCYSPEFIPTSLKENKKNFEKLENGLDIIKNIDIYKYHLKSQNDEDKKHIGFVIGDDFKYSKDVTSNENNGADLYSFVSVCCKAIQEQQEQINSLKEEIKKIKESDK